MSRIEVSDALLAIEKEIHCTSRRISQVEKALSSSYQPAYRYHLNLKDSTNPQQIKALYEHWLECRMDMESFHAVYNAALNSVPGDEQ